MQLKGGHMGLETDRVKKLVHSAVQFSSAELWEAIRQLKDMAQKRQGKEYIDRLKAWSKQLKEGDRVQLQVNGSLIPYGSEGTIKDIYLCRAPAVAKVGIEFDGHKGVYWYLIRSLAKAGSIDKETVNLNRSVARAIAGISA